MRTVTHNPLNILSLGAGVQSSTIAMMAATGEIEPPDCAIFVDTGDESKATYSHLAWLMGRGRLPFPVHRISAWGGGYGKNAIMQPLSDAILAACSDGFRPGSDARPPFFTANADGSKGQLRRQCTGDYKLDPLFKKIRELIGLKRRQRWPAEIKVVQWIGISTDESSRAKPAMITKTKNGKTFKGAHPTILNHFPLLDLGMSRADCIAWWKVKNLPVPPKSACVFCPYHSDAEWRKIKAVPEDWARAVQVDNAIRYGLKAKSLIADTYVHGSLKPLAEVDLSTAEERGQLNMFENECDGVCNT